MKSKSLVWIIASVLFAVMGFAAGTVTVTESRAGVVKVIKWSWTSSAGGAADQQTTYSYNGLIEGFCTVPSATTPPTANYDVTITDEDSIDVLNGTGANRSATLTEHVSRTLGVDLAVAANSKLTVNVSNAGNAKLGTVYLYIR